MENTQLVQIATQKLDEKYQELKTRLEKQQELEAALVELKQTRDSLVETLTLLSKLRPMSVTDLYAQVNGRMWVSHAVGIQQAFPGNIDIYVNQTSITRQAYRKPDGSSGYDNLEFPPGLYRMVLIAIPETPPAKKNERVDDYGRSY